jgi:hypothetical protein
MAPVSGEEELLGLKLTGDLNVPAGQVDGLQQITLLGQFSQS